METEPHISQAFQTGMEFGMYVDIKECSPGSPALRGPPSGSEDVHGAHHILSTDGTFAHALAALATRHHVATFQQHTVDG